MIRDKRRLQWVSALATSVLILCLGALSGYLAVDRLTETMEKQIAEDSRVISESLRIIISQVTRELTGSAGSDRSGPEGPRKRPDTRLAGIRLRSRQGWDCGCSSKPGHAGATVSLETYRPTATTPGLPLPQAVLELPNSGPLPP